MIAYINGIVTHRFSDSIILESSNIGYNIFCGNPLDFKLDETYKIYTYQHVREDAIILFGFKTLQECDLFKLLISVKGVGPKTGVAILGASGGKKLLEALETEDISYLKSLPGIGPKTASQILLDLKGKFVSLNTESNNLLSNSLSDVEDALLSMGFKRHEIQGIKEELNNSEYTELNELVKYGLQLLQARKRGV